jgi:DNA-binding XRE family transcriptional regulator
LQGCVAIFSGRPILLKALKPLPYLREPKTLGQHLKKRRLEQGLLQKDLRVRWQLEKETYANWEKDFTIPATKYWPNVIEFLGYDPSPTPTSIGESIRAYRRVKGLTRRELAKMVGCDEATLFRWERDERKPQERLTKLLSTKL